MSDDVRALARAFARHLEHLHDFRGVHYVGAGPMPRAAEPDGDDGEAIDADAPPPDTASEPASQDASTSEPSVAEPAAPPPAPDNTTQLRSTAQQWSAKTKLHYLRERNVGDCHRCALAKTRKNIVFGVGDPEADLMFVGEAPGADEDRRGEPFVGAAGRRLDQWIAKLGLRRDQVYIANVLKCRPPNNRDPKPEEIERCSPFLHAQIRAIEPKVIVALGRFAGCLLIGRDQKMYEMRGATHVYREPKSGTEVPVVVTYHPSYVIRREAEPQDARAAQRKPNQGGVIKSEDQKVLDDLQRAFALVRRGE